MHEGDIGVTGTESILFQKPELEWQCGRLRQWLTIQALRCAKCGYIELYAPAP